MKLVLSQMINLPPTEVLAALKKANLKSRAYPLYRFLFKRAWKSLTLDAKRVMLTMRNSIMRKPLSITFIGRISGIRGHGRGMRFGRYGVVST